MPTVRRVVIPLIIGVGLCLCGAILVASYFGVSATRAPVLAQRAPASAPPGTPAPTDAIENVPQPASTSNPASTPAQTSDTPVPVPTSMAPPNPGPMKEDVVRLTNEARIRNGQAELALDAQLSAAAQEWAETMASAGDYQHSGVDRLTSIMEAGTFGAVGENIHAPERQCSAGPSCTHVSAQPTSGTLHVDWLASSSHRQNMLDGRWDRVGVGVFCGVDGRVWAVSLFASSTPTIDQPILPPGTLTAPLEFNDAGYTCTGEFRESNPSWRHPVTLH